MADSLQFVWIQDDEFLRFLSGHIYDLWCLRPRLRINVSELTPNSRLMSYGHLRKRQRFDYM